MRFRRYAGGSAAIAASVTVMWSAAVLLPAEPLRSSHASGSPPVLSQYAFSGWCPYPLKFASASSLSNPHRFASRCARQHLQRTGSLAGARGAFETVAVHVVGEVADEPGVLHAEGGGGELGV